LKEDSTDATVLRELLLKRFQAVRDTKIELIVEGQKRGEIVRDAPDKRGCRRSRWRIRKRIRQALPVHRAHHAHGQALTMSLRASGYGAMPQPPFPAGPQHYGFS